MNMKAGKAPGPDSVLPSLLKCCANELSKILCEILNALSKRIEQNINSLLQEGVVPAVWKMSNIISVNKKEKEDVHFPCSQYIAPIILYLYCVVVDYVLG